MPRNKYRTLTTLPPASQFGRGESIIYQGEVLTSDGVNWTSQTGPLSYTAATLPDPATLGVGDVVDVGGILVTKNRNRLVRESKKSLPHPITSRNICNETTSSMSTGVTRGYQIYRDFLANCDVSGIDLTFSNFYVAQNGVETNNTSSVTIKVGVYKAGDTFVTPVFFNGSRTYTMSAGEIITSDKIPMLLRHGVDDGFFIRIWVSVAATSDTIAVPQYYVQNTNATTTATDIWSTYRSISVANTFVDDLATNFSKELGQGEFCPNVVRGWAADGSAIPSVIVLGDSLAQGVGDTIAAPNYVAGYISRSLTAQKIPYMNVAEGGETGANFLADGGAKRRKLLALCNATHSINTYGTNDAGGGATFDAVRVTLQRLNQLMLGYGTTPYFCTYTPATGSTDSWATVENQAVGSTVCRQLSAWLLNTSGYNVIDVEAVSDSGRVSGGASTGKWRVDLGQPTTDGLHGKAIMHQTIATAISYADIKF